MNQHGIKASPLGRWLGVEAHPIVATLAGSGAADTTDPISLSHWIIFGRRPSQDEAAYWTTRIGDQSLSSVLYNMYRASLPTTRAQWSRFYGCMGVSGPHAPRAHRSPSLAAVRLYLEDGRPEPDLRVIRRYLQALLRRPTDLASFALHVGRHLRRGSARPGRNGSNSRHVLNRRIPNDVIRTELLLLESIIRSSDENNGILSLVRALSPIPTFPEPDPVAVLASSTKRRFDEALVPFDIDLTVLERQLVPLLPAPGEPADPESIQAVAEMLEGILAGDEGEALLVLLYRHLLKREPDVSGYERHLASLKSGAVAIPDVLAAFIGSEEFNSRRRVEPHTR